MTNLTGPLINDVLTGGPRASRTKAPFSTTDSEYFVFFDDFLFDVVTISAAVHSVWTTIVDASGTTLKLADAPYGVLQMTAGATTENAGSSIQMVNESFDFSSGNEGWFETKVMLTDADQTDVFLGFTITFATAPENAVLAADRIGFELIDGAATWQCVTERTGVETRVVCNGTDIDGLLSVAPSTSAIDLTSNVDPDDAAWQKLAIHVSNTNDNGGGLVEFYIDDVKVCSTITNIPDDEYLSVAAFQLNGEVAQNDLYIDYIYAAGTR